MAGRTPTVWTTALTPLFRPVTQDVTEAHCLLTGEHTMRKLAKQKK